MNETENDDEDEYDVENPFESQRDEIVENKQEEVEEEIIGSHRQVIEVIPDEEKK